MTTKRTARNCTECATRLTPKNRANGGRDYDDVCNSCYDYWGWENTHSDGDHDNLPIDHDDRAGCLVCLNAKPTTRVEIETPAVVTGRTNRSHAACAHPRTPAGRAACRKANA